MEGSLVTSQAAIQVDLHPSKLGNVVDGVKEILNSLLLRYSEDYEGVPLAFSDIKILKNKAPIHSYFPFVHLDVKANSLLFKPAVGSMLEGTVIKMGTDFIGLLVLGVFNASILADSIRSELRATKDKGIVTWYHRKQPEHQIKVGTQVRFEVLGMKEDAGFFGIFGSLLKDNTGAVKFCGSAANGEASGKKGKLKKKQISESAVGTPLPRTPSVDVGKSEKKKKRSEGKADAVAHENGGGGETKKEKKKRKASVAGAEEAHERKKKKKEKS